MGVGLLLACYLWEGARRAPCGYARDGVCLYLSCFDWSFNYLNYSPTFQQDNNESIAIASSARLVRVLIKLKLYELAPAGELILIMGALIVVLST
jgi:hypothetical protein